MAFEIRRIISLLLLGLLAAHASAQSPERELIQDNHFQRGFILWETKPGQHIGYGELKGLKPEAKPVWGLSQWSSKFSVEAALAKYSDGALDCNNAAKTIRINGKPAEFTLAVNSRVEYGERAREMKDPWVHLLVEQEFDSPPRLADLSTAKLHLEARLLHSTNLHQGDYSPDRHAAQFQIFFTVQNRNRQSPGHGDLLWFGVPIYDNRDRFPKEFKAQDFGGTAKFIFTPGGNTYTEASAHDGKWIVIEKDLLPLMREALETAWARGFLKGSRDFADYHISGMNMGWELPGTFDVAMQVRNLSLKLAEKTTVSATPTELTNAVLHNPDMGWVLYENYPLDQDPHGSSTLLALPGENFPEVDAVALMFSWQDIETKHGVYDFTKVDHAYDYWARRGKEIQLRLSATTLLWWANRTPPAGKGTPDYVLERLSPVEKQTRTLEGQTYVVEDARNPFYRERLGKFLRAVAAHFSGDRKVTLVDLRGFGVWGEWHSGLRYLTLRQRRAALSGIIALWSRALPDHRLALSCSYDPDGPKELYAGPTDKFEARFTTNYSDFLRYSAFDHALSKENVTFRRDGCGGAVHSNERKLCEEAFARGRGPMVCEFVDGYAQSVKGGTSWVNWKINDALSLHPNYINLLGWQGGDALAFTRERPDLIAQGLLRLGYRLVPTRVQFPATIRSGVSFAIEMNWVNRGVGRALRDYELEMLLFDASGKEIAMAKAGKLPTSRWAAGTNYAAAVKLKFKGVSAGEYQLALRLKDPQTGRMIALPLANPGPDGAYGIGRIRLPNAKP